MMVDKLKGSKRLKAITRPLAIAAVAAVSALLLMQPVHAQSPMAVQTQGAEQNSDWMYTVRPGDTLWSIAKTYLDPRHSWHKLMHYNQLQGGADLDAGLVIRIPVEWLKQQPAPAVVRHVQGTVRLRQARQAQFKPLKAGQQLGIGDEIQTLSGNTSIRFADGSTLQLNENSTLIFNTLTRYGDSGMVDTRTRLVNGSLSTEVKRQQQGDRYEIATPSAVAAVRGTQFRLAADASSTRAEVTDGMVQLRTDRQTIPLSAGYGISIGGTRVMAPVSLLPAPSPSQLPRKIDRLPLTLDWQPVPGADHYIAEIYQSSASDAKVNSIRLGQTNWTLDQLNNGQYTLALRAVDGKGFQGMDFKADLQVEIRAKPAQPLSPADQERFEDGQPLFRWQIQQSGDLSRLEIAKDRDFTQLVSRTGFTSETQAIPAQRLTPGRYFWRVTTLAGGNDLNHSPVREIRIHGDMPKTNIMAINYFQDRVKLFWSSLAETSEFIVQIATDREFSNVVREERVSQPYVSIQLPAKRRYYARVKGVGDEFYYSDFSDGREIQLP